MASRGKSARTKGHSFERRVAQDFRDIDFDDAMTARAGDRAQDEAGCDIVNVLPFKVQCKAKKDYVSVSTMEEVKVSYGEIPVVVTKADRKKIRVILNYDDFLLLAKHLLP